MTSESSSAHRHSRLDPLKTIRVMGRFVRRQVKPHGSMPGTLVHTGRKKMERTRITFLDYDAELFEEAEVGDIAEVLPFRDSPTVSWVNIDGLHDVELVRRIGDHFGIHPLVLEDLVHVGQRPKAEVYEDYLYVSLAMLSWDEEARQVQEEQLSLLAGANWVLTFQERVGDFFEPVRERLRLARGKIRQRGADYLAYALLDAVVDRYYGVLVPLGEQADELELEVMGDPGEDTVRRLHHVKRELVAMRRAITPVRDVANDLMRTESTLMTDPTRVFLRDIQDHALQLTDAIESLRDVTSGLMDLYFSTVSQRTNEVMKVLTIMASIFIPLTFMAGIYGMNFQHMPELAIPWAYPALWVAMLAVGGGMVLWFRNKGWL
jgi:magnesium transporter